MHLVVFDIDGTLVNSNDFDGRLYVQAVQTVLELEIGNDWSRYRNVTDSGILDEILDNTESRMDRARAHSEVKEIFVSLVREYLQDRGGRLSEIPGAKAFVHHVKSKPNVSVAVATGGWKETALMKIGGIGLDPKELSLASGSDSVSRVEIMRIAEERALMGGQALRRTYFGDGPWDKNASDELGYDFIAIGDEVEHSVRYPDFSFADEILAELGLAD